MMGSQHDEELALITYDKNLGSGVVNMAVMCIPYV